MRKLRLRKGEVLAQGLRRNRRKMPSFPGLRGKQQLSLPPIALCGLAVYIATGDLGSSCVGQLSLPLQNREGSQVQAPAVKGKASTLTPSVLQTVERNRAHRPALPFSGCVTLGYALLLSEPQLPPIV